MFDTMYVYPTGLLLVLHLQQLETLKISTPTLTILVYTKGDVHVPNGRVFFSYFHLNDKLVDHPSNDGF